MKNYNLARYYPIELFWVTLGPKFSVLHFAAMCHHIHCMHKPVSHTLQHIDAHIDMHMIIAMQVKKCMCLSAFVFRVLISQRSKNLIISQAAFFKDYALAHKKLSELGSKFEPAQGIQI